MPLPSSGPLSLNDIQTEFGGTNPISLSEYYAGGANVPAGTTGTFGAVPSSGAISIRNFYGTSKVVYRLDTALYSDNGILGIEGAEVIFSVNSSGSVFGISGGTLVDSYNWLTPTTGSTTYFVRATLDSGSLTGGSSATGVWLPLTSDRFWLISLPDNTPATQIANLIVAIATDSGGTNIVVSANISLIATVS
jgi:hypothetical protein